jgi:hypothetical protein
MTDTPTRGGQAGTYLTPYNIQVSYGSAGAGIVRGDGADWFGPLNPLAPIAPADVAGRRFDFPAGYNLVTRPRSFEAIGFAELRAFADAHDLTRLVIETRKDQIERARWAINPRDPKARRKSYKIAPEMQQRIDALTAFFRKPDRITPWKTWIRGVLEDLFVLDAPALYCQRSRSGQLCALPQLDGATIKRVIDDWGRTPQPFTAADGTIVYPPAYQQILKGFPAVNYSVRDLIYRPRNLRAHKVYGYSPVQQVLMTVQIALRRQLWQLEYFTAGSVPDAFLGAPEAWTPDQIKQYQDYLDVMLSGELAARRRLRVVPGVKAQVTQTKEPEHKQDFDEWLARIICYAFAVSPQWATKMVGRAEAGQHSENAEQEGLEPTKEWIKEFVDSIIEDEFDSPDLEFAWVEEDETDPLKQEQILEGRVKAGGITLNEWRDSIGLDPYDDPAADTPMVYTATGFVPIDANTIDGKQAALDAFGPPPAPGGAGDKDQTPAAAGKRNDFGKRAGRRLAPVPFDRPAAHRAVGAIGKRLAQAFATIEPQVLAAVKDGLDKLAKDNPPRTKAKQILDDLDFAALADVEGDIADALGALGADSAVEALAQLGLDDDDLVNAVNDLAVKAAAEQGAELVAGVDDRTRAMLSDLIADGLINNIGTDAIADSIADSGLFSDDRADLIARTEVSRANSQAALTGYKSARDDAGVGVRKAWLLGPNPCEICEGNADDGDIDLDDDFSSGDDAPPAHPNCECALSPVVDD